MHCLVVFKDCRPLTGLDYHCTYRHVNVPVDREGMASSEDLFRAFSGAVAEDPYFGRIDLEHGTRKVTPGERWLLNPRGARELQRQEAAERGLGHARAGMGLTVLAKLRGSFLLAS